MFYFFFFQFNSVFNLAPPTFIVKPQDKKVGLNGVAQFPCVADGNPPPSVFWTKEGYSTLMFPNNSYGHLHVSIEGTLQINGVQKDDAGYYAESCYHLCIDESSTAGTVTSVNTMQSPAYDSCDDGGAAELEESKDDIRNSRSCVFFAHLR